MLRALDGLEAYESNLHRQNGSQDVNGAVSDVHSVREAASQDQSQYVERDQVDEEDITTP